MKSNIITIFFNKSTSEVTPRSLWNSYKKTRIDEHWYGGNTKPNIHFISL